MITPDTLLIKNHTVVLHTSLHEEIVLPNLTTLLNLYQTHKNTEVGHRIKAMLQCDIGTLLVIEIMIDASHPVTLERLKSGEISKNMKHVNDYNVILNSHLEDARKQFNEQASKGLVQGTFEDCCFNTMPFGTVILCSRFPHYKNTHYNKEAIDTLIN
nr:hypothetical protein [uncultured Cellulosilyticum sp.]